VDVARDWRGDPDAAERIHALDLGAERPSARARVRAGLARLADLVGASGLLLLGAPILLAGALLVMASSGTPVFFGHLRVGRGGRRFRCWKLRTMRSDAEERLAEDEELHRSYVANGFKLPTGKDPRVLPVGRWLRRAHVDELPQLWNVIRGDMALVGPRPIVPSELEMFGEHALALLGRRPGVFGEWTSLGRRRPPYPDRVAVEMAYVRDPSVARSVRILLRTVGVLLVGQGDGG
jgi:lipopolysaccharide/colanic/teichoic acid biosynthesis glycosyltransferase